MAALKESGPQLVTGPAKILVVDDNEANRIALRALLEGLGHRIDLASSGTDALRHLLTEDYAVLLIDIKMPEMDGFALASYVQQHERSQNTPIIFLTAALSVDNMPQAYAHGAVDFLVRPFEPSILQAKVAVFVNLFRRFERIKRKEAEIRAHERAETERELKVAAAEAANRSKDVFLATVAHELRNPLTAIMGYTRLARMAADAPDKLASALSAIDRNAELQARLIEDLLDQSRIVAGTLQITPQRLDLGEILEAAIDDVRSTAQEKGIELSLPPAPARGYEVWGDPHRLEQVTANLLSNAVKFTAAGGRVWATLSRKGTQVELAVADTGCGIPTNFLPHVFEHFQQGDNASAVTRPGLGLGLPIALRVIELHGGSIRAESPGEGKGAVFTVTLPALGVAAGWAQPR